MLTLADIVKVLGYADAPEYVKRVQDVDSVSRHTAEQLWRACEQASVTWGGVLLSGGGPGVDGPDHPPSIALFVCEAPSVGVARELHRRVWNLGTVPLLLVRLPNHLRLYSGHDFNLGEDRFLLSPEAPTGSDVRRTFESIAVEAVRTGATWRDLPGATPRRQEPFHKRFLGNLETLAECLQGTCSSPLKRQTAHALIGKYIFLHYLRSRGILTPEWLQVQRIAEVDVFGGKAHVAAFRQLCEAIEARFNGGVFCINFDGEDAPHDEHVSLVARVTAGKTELSPGSRRSDVIEQLCFEFSAYDFQYIPVETISRVYQQFLHADERGAKQGAYYTPEPLAEYVLAEVNAERALRPGMTVLDPACGSGVFLVLAYRRLIELRRAETGGETLRPTELRELLLNSIFGVEADPEACNVTVFSLILTLLHYAEPKELHRNPTFRFPALLGKNIHHADFFDPASGFAQACRDRRFDWVIGNPPWIEMKGDVRRATGEQEYALAWIRENEALRPVRNFRIHEAFAWRAADFCAASGLIGLVMPASTLFVPRAREFRKAFSRQMILERITDLANLRSWLFDPVTEPAAVLVYRPRRGNETPKKLVRHFSLLDVDQDLAREGGTLTIYERNLTWVRHEDVETEGYPVWKLALWGGERHHRALDFISAAFPQTLASFCEKRGWTKAGDCTMPIVGLQFARPPQNEVDKGKAVFLADWVRKRTTFDAAAFEGSRKARPWQRFTLSNAVLRMATDADCWCRLRGGLAGLVVCRAPHVMIGDLWGLCFIYSESDFLIPQRKFGISCPPEDRSVLKALTMLLASTFARFYVFYHAPQYGVYTGKPTVNPEDIRSLPVPDLTPEQVHGLAALHADVVRQEHKAIEGFPASEVQEEARQARIDDTVFRLLAIPTRIRRTLEDFRRYTLPLAAGGNAASFLARPAQQDDYMLYAKALKKALDGFLDGKGVHDVTVQHGSAFSCCTVRFLVGKDHGGSVRVDQAVAEDDDLLKQVRKATCEKVATGVWRQRSVRVYEGFEARILKPARLLEWIRPAALDDADDLAAEILGGGQ